MTWDYTTEYNKLLDILDQDTRPWLSSDLLPNDGTKVFLKCGVDYKDDTLYDVGEYQDYRKRSWYAPDSIEGEWCTEFGNMESVTGWKLIE